jgi:4-amino-4-deoxy-L-arabinose transferase-like glycosyltransferase
VIEEKDMTHDILSEQGRQWPVLVFLLCLLAFKVLFIVFSALELSPDEAYYWDWSRHLAWGYYSKPPMVAWLMALFTKLFGNNETGVRLPAALLSVTGLWFVYKLAREFYSERVARWALLSATLAPGAVAMSFIMTIDAPLICFWSIGLYVFWRALQSSGCAWWLLTGVVVGLGLLSKQTMVAFGVCAFLFMVFSRYRRLLLTPMPYLAAGIAFVMILPTLWWNYHHEWITFQHTAHHFEGLKQPRVFDILGLLGLLGTQIVIMSPATGILAIFTAGRMAVAWNRLRVEEHYLFFFGPLPFFLTMLLALRQDVNANWPAPFCLTFFLLLAGEWDRVSAGVSDRLISWFRPSVAVGLVLAVIIHAVPFLLSASAYSGGKWDMTARLKGWEDLAMEVHARLTSIQGEPPFLLSNRRQVVSVLAFYLPGQPQVLCWPEPGRIRNQYDLWPQFADKKGHSALIVLERKDPVPSGMAQSFDEILELPDIEISLGQQTRRYRVLYGRGFHLAEAP